MIADVPSPEFTRLLWSTLTALKELGGSGTNQEIETKAIEVAGLTEPQQAVLHKGGPKTEISYRLDWTRSYLGACNAVERSGRAVWSITETGRQLGEADMAAVEQALPRHGSQEGPAWRPCNLDGR